MKVILLDMNTELCSLWKYHLNSVKNVLYGQVDVSVTSSLLKDLHISNHKGHTTIVAPGNSLGYMNGGFDKGISEVFDNSSLPTVQHHIRNKIISNGYSSPTNAKLIKFSKDELKDTIALDKLDADSIIHIPTMRTPRCIYDKAKQLDSYRFVFDSTWNVLELIQRHNERHGFEDIETIVIPGFGTGYGGIPFSIASKSQIAAISIFFDQLHTIDEKSYIILSFLQEFDSTFIEKPQGLNLSKFDIHKDELNVLFSTSH